MNANQPKITSIKRSAARLALGLCVLGIVSLAGPGCATANKAEKEPVFAEPPAVTTTPAAPALAQATRPATSPTPPVATPLATDPQPSATQSTNPPIHESNPPTQPPANTPPASAPLAQQTQGKTLYAFTATALDPK